MKTPTFELASAHRWFAVSLNNRAWDLLESDGRTPEEDCAMLTGAHTSLFHWSEIGSPANVARAECLVANAHASLGDGHAAMRHARRCCDLVEHHATEMSDWDRAFAVDCLARAAAANGDLEQARQSKVEAQQLGERIAGEEDRAIFVKWHAAGNWHSLCNGRR